MSESSNYPCYPYRFTVGPNTSIICSTGINACGTQGNKAVATLYQTNGTYSSQTPVQINQGANTVFGPSNTVIITWTGSPSTTSINPFSVTVNGTSLTGSPPSSQSQCQCSDLLSSPSSSSNFFIEHWKWFAIGSGVLLCLIIILVIFFTVHRRKK
jgi:hypothetical protein